MATQGEPAASLADRRVVVVDDDPTVRSVLAAALRRAGALVETCFDGESALRCIRAVVPDLVLLDLAMPGIGGMEVLEALRAESATARLRVIIQTGCDDPANEARARQLRASAFLAKPLSPERVVETARRVLAGEDPLSN